MKFILSPVGTSLLTNNAGDAERKLLNRNSNAGTPDAIAPGDAAILAARIESVRQRLLYASLDEASQMSAEINGIVKIYDGQLNTKGDHHCLLCTDTWLGAATADMVAAYLQSKGLTVEVRRQRDLQTTDFEGFQSALSEIAAWCAETVNGYRDANYRVVFNLTGGFKGVQGFLQTLALFYADEAVYVFEQSADLMRIPRLPIRMDAKEFVMDNLKSIRRLSLGLAVDPIQLERVPETFVLRLGDLCSLSGYGEIVWNQSRDEIYRDGVHASPSERLRFGEKFIESVEKLSLPAHRYVEINRKIDQLARELETGQKLASVDLKELRNNPCPPSTHEADAWHDQDAKRLFGHFEGEILVLDKLDRALH
jgi:putative CRISPR-associated protein (TIGR02619 family)